MGELTWEVQGANNMLMVGSVSFATDKSFATVTIPASKTDPFRQGATLTVPAVPLSTCAVSALQVVCGSRPSSAPLLILDGDRPFDRSSFVATLHQCLAICRVEPSAYSGHSSAMVWRLGRPQMVLTTPPSVDWGAGRATASVTTSTNLLPTGRPSPKRHSTPTPPLPCHSTPSPGVTSDCFSWLGSPLLALQPQLMTVTPCGMPLAHQVATAGSSQVTLPS